MKKKENSKLLEEIEAVNKSLRETSKRLADLNKEISERDGKRS